MVSDPVGDFINRLTTGGSVRKESIMAPYSKFKHEVANKLKKAGFVKDVHKRGKKVHKHLEVELMYTESGTPRISGAERVSKPGCRRYTRKTDIRTVKYGKGALILSTPKGILTDREARKENVGGEALFKIW